MSWRVERFDRAFDRAAFDCGKASLNMFLTRLVSQYERRNLGRTYVLLKAEKQQVLGYYTLATQHLQIEDLPDDAAKGLARHPIPVILLARLAVDRSVQGQKCGAFLLRDALKRCFGVSEIVGVYAVFVETIDEEAVRFYEKFGFEPLKNLPDKLYLRVDTIRDGYGKDA